MVAIEVSDVSTHVGVCLPGVKHFRQICMFRYKNEMLQRCEELSRWCFRYSCHCSLAGPRKKPQLDVHFPTRSPTTLVGFLSSSFTRLKSVQLLSHFEHHFNLKKHTAYAFSSSQWSFRTLTRPSYAHCLMYDYHCLLSSKLTWTVHCPWIPTQQCHRGVQELEHGLMGEIWLQSMHSVVLVMNLHVQSTNQGA